MNIEDIWNPLSLEARCAVAQCCTEEVITWLIKNTKYPESDYAYVEICENLFDNPNLKPHHISELSGCESSRIQCLCASRTDDPDLLKKLWLTKDRYVLLAVARNIHTSHYMLDELAGNFYLDIVRTVASNPSTQAYTLTKLSIHKDLTVVEYVAIHNNTAPDTLLKLANHAALSVKMNVRQNPNTPTIASKVEKALGIEPGEDIVAAIENLKKARNDAVNALDQVDDSAFKRLQDEFKNFYDDVTAEIPHRFYRGIRTGDVIDSLRNWSQFQPIPPYSDSPADQIMEVIPEKFRKGSVVESVKALHKAWANQREHVRKLMEDYHG